MTTPRSRTDLHRSSAGDRRLHYIALAIISLAAIAIIAMVV